MKIKEVKIKNWRSIKDIPSINFEDLMVFVGQNNHGKSNILSAILFFFGKITPNEQDFFCGADDLSVEILFSNLDEEDKTTFSKYLDSDNNIRILKKASKGEGIAYHGYCETPIDDWLKEENASNYTSTYKEHPFHALVVPTGYGGKRAVTQDIINAQRSYIDLNKKNLSFSYNLEVGKFLGLSNVASGILGDVFFIPAVKHASEELESKGKGIFAQLLDKIINQMSENSEKYKSAKAEIAKLVVNLNKLDDTGSENIERPKELQGLESKLDTELASRGTKIDIQITPPKIDDLFKLGTNVLVDDGIKTDVGRKGNGLQRALIFALIKSWVELLKDEEIIAMGGRSKSNSKFFIFEEPELYLHPQAQRELYDALKKLSTVGDQVIITTHSSSFLDLEDYKSICIVRKDNIETGTYKLQCSSDLFPQADEKKMFKMCHWINPDRGELFFAKKILLVEGDTEVSVIPKLAKDLIGCYKYDYSIINCGSKDAIPNYINLLNQFKIPYTAIYDKDHQNGKNSQAIATANTQTKQIETIIDSTIGGNIVFINDIEEELGFKAGAKNKPLEAIKFISQSDFKLPEQLKNKITAIYE